MRGGEQRTAPERRCKRERRPVRPRGAARADEGEHQQQRRGPPGKRVGPDEECLRGVPRQIGHEASPRRGPHERIAGQRSQSRAPDDRQIEQQREQPGTDAGAQRSGDQPPTALLRHARGGEQEPGGRDAQRIEHHRDRVGTERADHGERREVDGARRFPQPIGDEQKDEEQGDDERIAARVRRVEHQRRRAGGERGAEQSHRGSREPASDRPGEWHDRDASQKGGEPQRPWLERRERRGELREDREEDVVVRELVGPDDGTPRTPDEIRPRHRLVVPHRLPEIGQPADRRERGDQPDDRPFADGAGAQAAAG
jgi:hypothetical protein